MTNVPNFRKKTEKEIEIETYVKPA